MSIKKLTHLYKNILYEINLLTASRIMYDFMLELRDIPMHLTQFNYIINTDKQSVCMCEYMLKLYNYITY